MYRNALLLLILLPLFAIAQNKKSSAPMKFQTSIGAGLLVGHSESSVNWQLVNGFKINNWFGGIGAGVDYYRYRTVPLFLSARRERLFHSNFFAFADAGLAIPAVRDNQRKEFVVRDKYYPGFYSETGIGWAIPANKKLSVRVSLGYSFRTVREEAEFPSFRSWWPSPNTEIEYRYKFQLLTLKTTVSLGG